MVVQRRRERGGRRVDVGVIRAARVARSGLHRNRHRRLEQRVGGLRDAARCAAAGAESLERQADVRSRRDRDVDRRRIRAGRHGTRRSRRRQVERLGSRGRRPRRPGRRLHRDLHAARHLRGHVYGDGDGRRWRQCLDDVQRLLLWRESRLHRHIRIERVHGKRAVAARLGGRNGGRLHRAAAHVLGHYSVRGRRRGGCRARLQLDRDARRGRPLARRRGRPQRSRLRPAVVAAEDRLGRGLWLAGRRFRHRRDPGHRRRRLASRPERERRQRHVDRRHGQRRHRPEWTRDGDGGHRRGRDEQRRRRGGRRLRGREGDARGRARRGRHRPGQRHHPGPRLGGRPQRGRRADGVLEPGLLGVAAGGDRLRVVEGRRARGGDRQRRFLDGELPGRRPRRRRRVGDGLRRCGLVVEQHGRGRVPGRTGRRHRHDVGRWGLRVGDRHVGGCG